MSQVRELTAQGKVNEQIDRTARTTKDIIKENVFTYFNLIFLIISLLLILAGALNSLTFLPVVIANMLIGIFQELHAKKVLDNLSILHEPNAIAIRDGSRSKVPIEKLVLGDLIVLRAGNQIPADAEVVEGEVAVNEALLTGEADEIVKGPGDQLMSGSFVASGECLAELTKVGKDSYISKLMLKARKMPRHAFHPELRHAGQQLQRQRSRHGGGRHRHDPRGLVPPGQCDAGDQHCALGKAQGHAPRHEEY